MVSGFESEDLESEDFESPFFDSATPSGNGAAALLGLWLGRYYGRSDWESYAEEVTRQVADHLLRAVTGFGTILQAIEFFASPSHELVVVGSPEARRPLEDAVAGYEWLLAQGIAPERVVVAGDSAGGGLTVATLLALRDRGLPRAAGGVCISPWVDLTCSGASYATKAGADPIVTRDGVEAMAQAYVGAGDRKAALVSPLYADLRNLPPLLVQVGSDEVLLDDALGLGARARAAGVDVKVEEWPAMVHVWHWFYPMLDEGEKAIAGIGEFVRARIR